MPSDTYSHVEVQRVLTEGFRAVENMEDALGGRGQDDLDTIESVLSVAKHYIATLEAAATPPTSDAVREALLAEHEAVYQVGQCRCRVMNAKYASCFPGSETSEQAAMALDTAETALSVAYGEAYYALLHADTAALANRAATSHRHACATCSKYRGLGACQECSPPCPTPADGVDAWELITTEQRDADRADAAKVARLEADGEHAEAMLGAVLSALQTECYEAPSDSPQVRVWMAYQRAAERLRLAPQPTHEEADAL